MKLKYGKKKESPTKVGLPIFVSICTDYRSKRLRIASLSAS